MMYFHMTQAQMHARLQTFASYEEFMCFSFCCSRYFGITWKGNSLHQPRLNGLCQVNGLQMGAIS